MKVLTGLGMLVLSGCAGGGLTPQGAAAVQVGVTLATVAAQNDTTAGKIVAAGQLLCMTEKGVVAVMGTSALGAGKPFVDAVCAGLGGTATALPAGVDPGSVPAVVAKL